MAEASKRTYTWRIADLRHLGILGLLGFFMDPRLKLFFLLYLIDFLGMFRQAKEAEDKGVDLRAYYRTMVYSQLNVLSWPKIVFQLLGQFVIIIRHPKGLPSPAAYVNKSKYRLPFNGRWKTLNGGTTRENSHSWEIFTQRYAYDFVIWDEDGKSHRGDGNKVSDYYCWAKEIIAIADGQVVCVRDNVKDYTGVGDYSIDWKTRDFRGNFVVIRHAPGEYSFSAHLMKGSITVKKGDLVKAGDVIGLCGNSGHSTEPHLHFHLQDSPGFWFAAGLPIRFRCFTNGNEQQIKDSFVEKDQTIEGCI